ncbi:MAG: hypothetical protein L6R36_003238 [Xanthoria steineri]|nr:MAG: hypothetical protein L6R36_003238 [Xanthoria steineri]
MASVAVIVLGILLAKNRGAHNQRDPTVDSPPPPETTPCSNGNSTFPRLQTPKSSCPALPKNHTVAANPASAINASTDFTLRCGHDYKLPLIMGIRTYTFENCIDACASQRTNVYANGADASLACTAMAYKPDSGQMLTCWLKSDLGNTGTGEIESQGVDGAVVV